MIPLVLYGKYGRMEVDGLFSLNKHVARLFNIQKQMSKIKKKISIKIYDSLYNIGKEHATMNNLNMREEDYEAYGKQLLKNNPYMIKEHPDFHCFFEIIGAYKEPLNEEFDIHKKICIIEETQE